jgi:hypothetical protein
VVGKLLSLRRSTLQGPQESISQKLDLGWQSDHLQKKVLMENRAGRKMSVALHFVRIFKRFEAFALDCTVWPTRGASVQFCEKCKNLSAHDLQVGFRSVVLPPRFFGVVNLLFNKLFKMRAD